MARAGVAFVEGGLDLLRLPDTGARRDCPVVSDRTAGTAGVVGQGPQASVAAAESE